MESSWYTQSRTSVVVYSSAPTAHGAGGRFRIIAAGGGVAPDKIERRAHHVAPRGGNDGVCLGVDAAAELVPLSGGDVQLAPGAAAEIGTVAPSARGAVVAGGDDLVVTHDDRAELPPETGAALQSGLGNVEIVILLAAAVVHGYFSNLFLC